MSLPFEPASEARTNFRTRATGSPRGQVASACAVVLATLGVVMPGPRTPARSAEAFRITLRGDTPNAVPISVLRSGDASGIRVILVHGTPGRATGWTDYLVDPPLGTEIWAIDRLGFGDSGPRRAQTSLQQQAAAVAALLPTDGRPTILLGHSYGGPVVARVAAEHPSRIDALVLLAASLDPALESIHFMQRVVALPPLRAMLPRAIRNANEELMTLKVELGALQPRLAAIRAPVLIVHGTHDDLVPVANVDYMQKHLTGSKQITTVLLEGRNHFLPWNSVEAVREAIRGAVAKVTERPATTSVADEHGVAPMSDQLTSAPAAFNGLAPC